MMVSGFTMDSPRLLREETPMLMIAREAPAIGSAYEHTQKECGL